MVFDQTAADALLKTVWEERLENMTYAKNPLLQRVKKAQWDGEDFHVAMIGGNNAAGASNSFPNALNNVGSSLVRKFQVPLKQVHSLGSVSHVTIETTKNKRGAITAGLEFEIDRTLDAMNNKIESQLWRSGGGGIGQVGSFTATAITLSDPEDVVNFEVGMQLDSDTVDGGGTSNAGDTSSSTSVLTAIEPITKVNRRTGVLTGAAWTDISGIANNDFLFQAGDYDKALTGVGGYIPAADPDSTAFLGLDRTSDLTRFSGVRVLASEVSGAPIEEKLQHLLSRVAREGGSPDCIFMNYANVRDLEISLGSKVVVSSDSVNVGFKKIQILGPNGPVEVVAAARVPGNRAYALEMDSWMLLGTKGGMPALQDADGGKILRAGAANNYEFRVFQYGNLVCRAPGHNGVVDLS